MAFISPVSTPSFSCAEMMVSSFLMLCFPHQRVIHYPSQIFHSSHIHIHVPFLFGNTRVVSFVSLKSSSHTFSMSHVPSLYNFCKSSTAQDTQRLTQLHPSIHPSIHPSLLLCRFPSLQSLLNQLLGTRSWAKQADQVLFLILIFSLNSNIEGEWFLPNTWDANL